MPGQKSAISQNFSHQRIRELNPKLSCDTTLLKKSAFHSSELVGQSDLDPIFVSSSPGEVELTRERDDDRTDERSTTMFSNRWKCSKSSRMGIFLSHLSALCAYRSESAMSFPGSPISLWNGGSEGSHSTEGVWFKLAFLKIEASDIHFVSLT